MIDGIRSIKVFGMGVCCGIGPTCYVHIHGESSAVISRGPNPVQGTVSYCSLLATRAYATAAATAVGKEPRVSFLNCALYLLGEPRLVCNTKRQKLRAHLRAVAGRRKCFWIRNLLTCMIVDRTKPGLHCVEVPADRLQSVCIGIIGDEIDLGPRDARPAVKRSGS